jgi:ferrous iron transport protein A
MRGRSAGRRSVKKATHRQTISLKDLPAGRCARITRVLGHPDHVHQLEEFGLRGGTKIEMFRPGDPCILRLAGNKICLRADDMLHVLVEPAAG